MQRFQPDSTISNSPPWVIVGAATAHEAIDEGVLTRDGDATHVQATGGIGGVAPRLEVGFPPALTPFSTDPVEAFGLLSVRARTNLSLKQFTFEVHAGPAFLGTITFDFSGTYTTQTKPFNLDTPGADWSDLWISIETVPIPDFVQWRVTAVDLLLPNPVAQWTPSTGTAPAWGRGFATSSTSATAPAWGRGAPASSPAGQAVAPGHGHGWAPSADLGVIWPTPIPPDRLDRILRPWALSIPPRTLAYPRAWSSGASQANGQESGSQAAGARAAAAATGAAHGARAGGRALLAVASGAQHGNEPAGRGLSALASGATLERTATGRASAAEATGAETEVPPR